ncbi:MAG: hypothetical protein KKB90_05415 [Actinobacteria bacterium]|nr:hypothetical protein [Actinomycetota bacterium]MCG2818140.1 hypothetical protein [Actinomycetes bacterium]MBU4218386.1 hypothetical protein [Actinomycetota bacterium]MBU4359420.1 hypothetical protein [Actinomycetota bacterium]MBU4392503.1 hypothetical protein [Actinomycetota bacterium]
MYKLLANPMYVWAGALGAKVTAILGIYSAATDRKVAGLDHDTWLQLATVYFMVVIASLVARMVVQDEEHHKG